MDERCLFSQFFPLLFQLSIQICLHYFVYKIVVPQCVLQFVQIFLFIRLLPSHMYCSLFTFFVYKVVVLACVLQFIILFFFYNVVVLTYVLQFIYIILFTRLLSLHVYCSWRNQRKHFKKMLRERSLIENTPYHSQHTLSRRYTSV